MGRRDLKHGAYNVPIGFLVRKTKLKKKKQDKTLEAWGMFY